MPASPNFDFTWIDSSRGLSDAVSACRAEKVLSVDTETVGWQTGNEQLCLIQIGLPLARHVFVVDALAVKDLQPLSEVLSEESPFIVAHNASFEERQFNRSGIKVRGVRDTLTMSRTLRPDLPNHTLRTCCKLLLDIDLDKEPQTSDWSIRPLSTRQLEYARLDAEVAIFLYDYLFRLETEVSQDLERAVPELMAEYGQTVRRRYELIRSIAHEAAFLAAREAKLRDTIRLRLIEGAPAYDGPVGSASVSKVRRTEINPQKVREVFPELAGDLIQEYVERKRFEAVTKEHGLPKSAIESVLETVGFNERLSLNLKDETGQAE